MSLIGNSSGLNAKQRFITFVCTGNTCRSPMAEYLMRAALVKENDPVLNDLLCQSAGLAASNGDAATRNAEIVLAELDIDLSPHRSRTLTQKIIDESFAIFCMTPTHKEAIENYFRVGTPHLFLLRELIPNNTSKDLPDPFGGNVEQYRHCRDAIAEAIPSIVQYLKHVIA